uniref:DRBM domain-containing protein n=1 Tax=Leersia perrieri TaxID=77586 RepID=A0A0D9XW49_9ORYZ
MDGGGMAMAPEPLPQEPANTSTAPAASGIRVENCYVFKSRLQEYAQKANLPTPEYHTLKEGPSHEPVFKSTVVFNNTKYESLPGFFNRKAAEQSAAEVALMDIVKSIPANANIPAVQETGLCKNLLQEYAQKMNYAIPSYICTRQASGLFPYICTVEIGGIQYIGAAARTKKEAEIKAARTALLAIQGQSEGCVNGATKYIVVPGKRQGKEVEKRPIETLKPLKVKKGGLKKKWNKRKFMKKNGQNADLEKDEAMVAGDAYGSDVLMQPTVITQEPFSDALFLQTYEEAKRVEPEPPKDIEMAQPNKEMQPSEAAMGQLDEEARSVEQEPSRDTSVMQLSSIKQDRSVKQELDSDTAMPQPDKDTRIVKEAPRTQPNGEATSIEEPPRNAAIMQPEEAITAKQEPRSNAPLLQTDLKLENSECLYEHKNQSSGATSPETNKAFGDMTGIDSYAPTSNAREE